MQKYKAIIVDDNTEWLDLLMEVAKSNFDNLEIEGISSFEVAKKRILQKPPVVNLLITDLFLREDSKDPEGKKLIKQAIRQKIPIIVVTIVRSFVKDIVKNYDVIDVFDKNYWEELDFIEAIHIAISQIKKEGTYNKTNNQRFSKPLEKGVQNPQKESTSDLKENENFDKSNDKIKKLGDFG